MRAQKCGCLNIRKTLPSYWDAYEKFNTKILSVSEDLRGGVINVAIRWNDRVAAAEWANGVVQRTNAQLRQKHIAQAEAGLGFLYRELDSQDSIELRNAVSKMIESQLHSIMVAKAQPDFAFRVVDPAIAPDEDNPVSPNRLVFFLVGGILFGFSAVVLALVKHAGGKD